MVTFKFLEYYLGKQGVITLAGDNSAFPRLAAPEEVWVTCEWHLAQNEAQGGSTFPGNAGGCC